MMPHIPQPTPQQIANAARAEVASIIPRIEAFEMLREKLIAAVTKLHNRIELESSVEEDLTMCTAQTTLAIAEFELAQATFALMQLTDRKIALENAAKQNESMIQLPHMGRA